MPLQPNGRAPYTSVSAATLVLDAYRARGLGLPITAETLVRAGVPESLSTRTYRSLLELELVDEKGQPTPTFEAFRQTRGDEEYRTRLQEWIRDVYGDILQYGDPSVDVLERIQEAFRGYQPDGQRGAMAALFVGLWQYAGLPVIATDGGTVVRPPTIKVKGNVRRPSTTGKKATRTPETPYVKGYQPDDQALPPGLVGLLREIPRSGETWTSDRRNAFIKAFEAILDFTIRVDDNPNPKVPDEGVVS